MSKRKPRHAKAPPKPEAEKVAAADAAGQAGAAGEGTEQPAMAGGAPVEAVEKTTASDDARHDDPADQGAGGVSGVKEGKTDGQDQGEEARLEQPGDPTDAQGQRDPAGEEAGGQDDACPPAWKMLLDHILGQELTLGEETETVIRCWAHAMDGSMEMEKVHAFLDTIGLSLNDGKRLLVIDTPAVDELMREIPLDDHWWRVLCEMPKELYQLEALSWREGNPLAIDIDIDLYLRGGHYKNDPREQPPEAPQNIMDVNVLAAAAAASAAFGTHDGDGTTLPRMDYSWLTPEPPIAPAAECAASFLRRHPATQPQTLALHLKRNGHCPAEAGDRVSVAWAVFAIALAALDMLDEAKKRQAEAARPTRPMGARLEDQTWAPPDERQLTDIGRRAQRKMAKDARIKAAIEGNKA